MKYVSNRDEADQVVPGHRYLMRWIKPYLKKTKVLDIGCWTGPLETLLENEDCKVSAIDIEEDGVIYRTYNSYSGCGNDYFSFSLKWNEVNKPLEYFE